MNTFPVINRETNSVLVVRTDYTDAAAWQAVVAEMMRPWGDDEDMEAFVHFVDDPAWAGATPEEIEVAASANDEMISVVFVADALTMQEPHHALLAVKITTGEDEEEQEPANAEEWAHLSRPFRTEPSEAHNIHVNLDLANMDFEEFAEAALRDPEGVLRRDTD
ncbi:hypothetical protein [Streptomyces sp. NPDC029554]|uniref:DUF6924 domain-containing protein n=1 Tax=Streptomyces sp. NPDC029554 TaxID=3155126 RepID=UPI003405A3E1